jgi:hypothetical protein
MMLFYMQCLPILQRTFPGHWLFFKHPLFKPECNHQDRALWNKWSAVQVAVYTDVSQHYDAQMVAGMMPSELQPYLPAHQLDEQLRDVGGKWDFEDKTPRASADPCKWMALKQVSFSTTSDLG